MEKLLVATYIDFWRKGAGHRARLSALLHYLKDRVEVTVVYIGRLSEKDSLILKEEFPDIEMVCLEKEHDLSSDEYGNLFGDFINHNFFRYVLIEYLELSFLLPYLPPSTITFLDTHDIISDRIVSFEEGGLIYSGIKISKTSEMEIFNNYDYIILIQKNDYEQLKQTFDEERLLLMPHSTRFRKKDVRDKVSHIGYVGSEYSPNVEGLRWFLENVWPKVYQENTISFNIYGNICDQISDLTQKLQGIELNSFVANIDIVYDHCDIMINPVRYGAGLKIKTVEALANNVPLITTTHGSQGIEEASSSAYLIANTAEEFHSSINAMCSDYELRKKIADNGYNFAKDRFSPETCYFPFIDAINKHSQM